MYHTIQELINRLECCAGCGNFIVPYFYNSGKVNVSVGSPEEMSKERVNLAYASKFSDNKLSLCWILHPNELNTILEVDILTNKVSGELERIQNVFWTNTLSLFRYCNNKACKTRYMSESSPLYLERKAMKILPFHLSLEGYFYLREDASGLFLFNSSEMLTNKNKTVLASYSENAVSADVISHLPRIDFSSIKSGIDKKIKTIITFL